MAKTVEAPPEVTDIEFIRQTILPLLSEEEAKSFDVRPGVTFRDIEIFLMDRVGCLQAEKFRQQRELGIADATVRGLLDRLRNKRFMNRCPTCGGSAESYRRKDVLREIGHALWEPIYEGGGPKFEGSEDIADLWRVIRERRSYLAAAVKSHERHNKVLDTSVEKLGVSGHVITALKKAGILNVRKLTEMTQGEVEATSGIGVVAASQIRTALGDLRLKFRRSEETNEE